MRDIRVGMPIFRIMTSTCKKSAAKKEQAYNTCCTLFPTPLPAIGARPVSTVQVSESRLRIENGGHSRIGQAHCSNDKPVEKKSINCSRNMLNMGSGYLDAPTCFVVCLAQRCERA